MDIVDGRARDAADRGLHSPDGQFTSLERDKDLVGENWVRKFLDRHDEIKAKYSVLSPIRFTNVPSARTRKRSNNGTIEWRRRSRNGGFSTRMSTTLTRRVFRWE
ncbi:hypothetical protein HIM_11557 [Hirsutella minnesotensis 3608]|uniref:HTH CENPB-type domain-containing protein n=1 Tax=Hirsutella minnesotensis 3608 TaxID=1043627 RepID=A0A0F7ZFF4_9HYPO|nr:hypothetical protein HIM_11557 [Hirsutella minnesotensis 3608]